MDLSAAQIQPSKHISGSPTGLEESTKCLEISPKPLEEPPNEPVEPFEKSPKPLDDSPKPLGEPPKPLDEPLKPLIEPPRSFEGVGVSPNALDELPSPVVPTLHDLLFWLIKLDFNRLGVTFHTGRTSCTFLNRPLLSKPLHLVFAIQRFRGQFKDSSEEVWNRIFLDYMSIYSDMNEELSTCEKMFERSMSWILEGETSIWQVVAIILVFTAELCKKCIELDDDSTEKCGEVFITSVGYMLDRKFLHFVAQEGGWTTMIWSLGKYVKK